MRTEGKVARQTPSTMPAHKYRSFVETNPITLPDRTWPDNRITKAPRWMSTDLRDGNQSLIEPMDPARKRQMFDLLVAMGFKEIEIGFPAASKADFDFCRSLVESNAVPEDVTISVLTQARPEIIHRTIDALDGLPRATVHLYNATSPLFRRVVFHNDREATLALAVAGAQDVISYMEKRLPETTIAGFEYSPEFFVDTEIDFAIDVCSAVMNVWQPGPEREIILNLPTTVERCTPNTYADQIEYFCRNLPGREHAVISCHNHNDRGTGVATTELALLAGVDRVEGCLFGHGERTGNVDLITVALNLYSQGVDPELKLDNIDEIRRIVEHCTSMDVPPRTPYGGDLVYTSFSGSHQDAIKKGFADRATRIAEAGGNEDTVTWDVPYLPIDPRDVGRSYEAVVRVNSQSGKGGVAYLMSTTRHLDLPRRMQLELSGIVQRWTDREGGEVTAERLWQIFVDEYLPSKAAQGLRPWGKYRLVSSVVTTGSEAEQSHLSALIAEHTSEGESEHAIDTHGNGPIDAFVVGLRELGVDIRVLDYAEHALSEGGDATAAAYLECEVNGVVLWGCGIDPSTVRASFKAIISAVNRALR